MLGICGVLQSDSLDSGKMSRAVFTANRTESQNRGCPHCHTMLFPVDEFHVNTTPALKISTEVTFGIFSFKWSLISDSASSYENKGCVRLVGETKFVFIPK